MNKVSRTIPYLGYIALITSASVSSLAASAPPDDCEVSPCYWHFGDADTKIEVYDLEKLRGTAGRSVIFLPEMNGDPAFCQNSGETPPWVVSDSNTDPENGCQDRFYRGEFQFDEDPERCRRERSARVFGEADASAMGTYRLWVLARPQQISVNFDKIANNEAEAGAHSGATQRGGSGSSGITNDGDFLAIIVPFTVEPTTLPVRLKLNAQFLSTLGNATEQQCSQVGSSWSNESRLWGGCGVWVRDADVDAEALEGLNQFAGDGFGTKAIVLNEDNPLVTDFTEDPVKLPAGDYELRYWVHSYSRLDVNAQQRCEFAQSNTDTHIFQTWLELVSDELLVADINSDGYVNIDDFSEFLVQFRLGVCDSDETRGLYTADLNDDGCVNTDDFSLFIVEFGAAMDCSTRR